MERRAVARPDDHRVRLARGLTRLACIAVGLVLAFAGWGKINAPDATERVLAFIGVTPPYPQVVTAVLPGVELALGAALVLGWRSRLLLAGTVALLLGFTGFLVLLAFARYDGSCGCLGPVIDRWSGGSPVTGIARNLVLLALLAWPTVCAFRKSGSISAQSRKSARLSPVTTTIGVVLLAMLGSVKAHSQEHVSPPNRRPQLTEPWAPSFEHPLRSVFTRRFVVEEVSDWFEMTDDQRVILELLHQEHEAKFDAFIQEVAPIWQPLEEEMLALPRSTLARTKAHLVYEIAVARIADRQEAVDMEFLDSIRLVLDERQAERWDEFRMWLSRHRWGNRAGMFSEQSVDLIALLHEVDREFPNQSVSVPQDLIMGYARHIDHALSELATFEIDWSRNRMRNAEDRRQTDGERTWLGPHPNPREQDRENERRLSLNARISDLNRQYTAMFASALPEPQARAWRRLYRESVILRISYDRDLSSTVRDSLAKSVRGANSFARIVTRARHDVPDLNEKQQSALDNLVAQHDQSLNAALKRLIVAFDELASSPFRDQVGRNKRAELEARYDAEAKTFAEVEARSMQILRAVLTPDQFALVSESPSGK